MFSAEWVSVLSGKVKGVISLANSSDYAVELRDIRKSFGTVLALKGVNLSLKKGEILALLGDNGAGKSTLIKILAGLHRPDSGEMLIHGKSVDFSRYSVGHARNMGIETVYQERSLAELQPLWRNVFVGRPIRNALGFIDVRREKEETMKLLSGVLGLRGVGLSADASVSTLSGGERQGLAIARAMYFDASIIILDEPTTALAVSEVEKVLSFVESIREDGRSCIFISHDMPLVYRIADRFAFMEKGRVGTVIEKEDTDLEYLIHRLVVGEDVSHVG